MVELGVKAIKRYSIYKLMQGILIIKIYGINDKLVKLICTDMVSNLQRYLWEINPFQFYIIITTTKFVQSYHLVKIQKQFAIKINW